jgi:hypothetical protein
MPEARSYLTVEIGGFGFVCLHLSTGMPIRLTNGATQQGITHPTLSVLEESFSFIPMLTYIVHTRSRSEIGGWPVASTLSTHI